MSTGSIDSHQIVTTPSQRSAPRYFGGVRKLPSGRYQARYVGPDGRRHPARKENGGPLTFDTKGDAESWLSLRHSEILRQEWLPPAATKKAAPIDLRTFADAWLVQRDLEDRTSEHYAQLLRDHVYPILGRLPIASIAPGDVRTWHATLSATTGPTARAHAYDLLRAVLKTAMDDDLIAANPCRIRGAGQAKRARKVRPATLAELEAITKAVPAKYQLMILLAAWLALRFGELAELRRSDIDLASGVVHIRRGVVRTKAGRKVKDPKSEAGKRKVAIPPHLMSTVKNHLREHAAMGRDGLIFPARHGEQLAPSTLYKVFYPAREKAGRPDLRFHDLRHTGAVLAASTGASLK